MSLDLATTMLAQTLHDVIAVSRWLWCKPEYCIAARFKERPHRCFEMSATTVRNPTLTDLENLVTWSYVQAAQWSCRFGFELVEPIGREFRPIELGFQTSEQFKAILDSGAFKPPSQIGVLFEREVRSA